MPKGETQSCLYLPVQLVDEHMAEERRRVLADRLVGGHEAEVCIHGVGLFVVIPVPICVI